MHVRNRRHNKVALKNDIAGDKYSNMKTVEREYRYLLIKSTANLFQAFLSFLGCVFIIYIFMKMCLFIQGDYGSEGLSMEWKKDKNNILYWVTFHKLNDTTFGMPEMLL